MEMRENRQSWTVKLFDSEQNEFNNLFNFFWILDNSYSYSCTFFCKDSELGFYNKIPNYLPKNTVQKEFVQLADYPNADAYLIIEGQGFSITVLLLKEDSPEFAAVPLWSLLFLNLKLPL